MLRIDLINDVLTFECDGDKFECIDKPLFTSNGNNIRIILKYGETTIEQNFTFSEIEINGTPYSSTNEILSELKKLCEVFKQGGTGGGGVSPSDVANAIDNHDKSLTAHINVIEDLVSTSKTLNPPELRTFYKFGTLTNLTLQNVPDSVQPIVIWFLSGTTKTTISLPSDVKVSGAVPDVNKSYELSIVNKKCVIVEFS